MDVLMQVVNKADLFEGGLLPEASSEGAPCWVPTEVALSGRGGAAEPVGMTSTSCSGQVPKEDALGVQLGRSNGGGSRAQEGGAADASTAGQQGPVTQLKQLQEQLRARSGDMVITSAVSGEGLDDLLLEIDRRVGGHPVVG